MRNPNRKRKPKHIFHKKNSVVYWFMTGTYVIHIYKFNRSVKCTRVVKGVKLD